MDWAYVLVIILSVFLAIFLLLGIILTILLIRVSIQIKNVTESAQRTADSIENIVGNASRFSSPMLIGRMFVKQIKKVRGAKK